MLILNTDDPSGRSYTNAPTLNLANSTGLPAAQLSGVVPTTVRISPSSITNDGTQFAPGTITKGTTNSTAGMVRGAMFEDVNTNSWLSRDGQIFTNLLAANIVGAVPTAINATNLAGAAVTVNLSTAAPTATFTQNGALTLNLQTNAWLTASSNLDATKLTGTVPSGNLPALNYVPLTNGTAVNPTLVNPTFSGTATNAPWVSTNAPQIAATFFGGISGTVITSGNLQYYPTGFGTASTPTTEARVAYLPVGGYLSNFWFRTYSTSALGAGTNLNVTLLTNGVVGVNPVSCGLIVSLQGNGVAQSLASSNLTAAIPVIQGGNFCLLITNTAAVSTPSTGLSWGFSLYKSP